MRRSYLLSTIVDHSVGLVRKEIFSLPAIIIVLFIFGFIRSIRHGRLMLSDQTSRPALKGGLDKDRLYFVLYFHSALIGTEWLGELQSCIAVLSVAMG